MVIEDRHKKSSPCCIIHCIYKQDLDAFLNIYLTYGMFFLRESVTPTSLIQKNKLQKKGYYKSLELHLP